MREWNGLLIQICLITLIIKLLKKYFQEARQSGLNQITLSVSDSNQGAHLLYRRLGFQKQKDLYAFVRDAN